MRKILCCNKGQAVTEFALVMPIFLLIIVVTISFGMKIYTKTILIFAATQAARTATFVYPDETISLEDKMKMIDASAEIIIKNGLIDTQMDVQCRFFDENSDVIENMTSDSPRMVVVKVDYEFVQIYPLSGGVFDQSSYVLSYTAVSAMR